MPSSIENRIVKMEFDNAAFAKKLEDTIRALGDLDKTLQMKGASKGLADVSDTASRMNFNPLTNAVSGLSAGFIALSTIAITALSRITNAAITAGAQMVKALSIQPVIDGFREYELNIGSIQTILANTKADGTNLQQVNKALDELNEYADLTIYNFAEMTRNIGTFTAAGVDLDTSVRSIKGIANLAAISGSSSQQASTAMYQLSQAIATGTLKLMDWNSVVNAGMGGEVFQRALFEAGKAMGTLNDVPIDQTFDEWTDAGNSFRESLQDGWITADVLTTTLEGFTGELSAAELKAKGFTDAQVKNIQELGDLGVESATKVRTLTQLISTVQESLGSGFAQSFRTIVGDFEQATKLFTRISEAITGFTDSISKSRNILLEDWAGLGGREVLIKGVTDAFKALGDILKPIGEAFRDVFPPLTSRRLLDLTKSFASFTKSLKPSEKTIENIKRVFTGFFSAIDLGIDILRGFIGFVKDLVIQVTGLGEGHFLEFAADIADFFTSLREGLDDGDKITDFFDNLLIAVSAPIDAIKDLRDAIIGFFTGIDPDEANATGESFGRLGERFDQLKSSLSGAGGLLDPIAGALKRLRDILSTVGGAIVDWFKDLGQAIADAMGEHNFDAVLDALNTTLLGGIALMIANFIRRGGFNFTGGIFENIAETFEELTGVLSAMQAEIRSNALLKIAAAIGILTASVLVLSTIDSAALSKALGAMAVGFGQLLGAFTLLNRLDFTGFSGLKLAAVATAMIAMGVAILILSGALKVLATIGWEDLAKGLLSITVILGVLTASSVILSKNSGNILLASISMIAMAVAISLLAGAVKLFAQFEWSEMLRGFAGVAAGLLILAGAMRLMPTGLGLQGLGLLLVAAALNVLALAVRQFSSFSWEELGKGFAAIGAGLVLIGLAMRLMPEKRMLRNAAALVVVGVALNIIARALTQFGGMSWSEIARGLVALGASMLILAVATRAMSSALSGAAAMLVVAVAVGILGKVLQELSKVPFGDILKALGAIALAILLFAGAAAVIQNLGLTPALIGLGAALVLVGAAAALFGIGALAAAKAFEILANAGPAGAKALLEALKAVGKALPSILKGLAEGLLEMLQVFVDAAPVIADGLGVILKQLLETIRDILPAVGEVILALIETILEVVQEAYPQLIETGIGLVLALLTGIRENIGEIVTLVLEIIEEFLTAIGDNLEDVILAGSSVIVAFIDGLGSHPQNIVAAAGRLIRKFIGAIAGLATDIQQAGVDALVTFLDGITDNLVKVVNAVGRMVRKFITAVGNNATSIGKAGADALVDFLNGIGDNIVKVGNAAGTVVVKFINTIGNNAARITRAGANAIIKLINGLGQHGNRIVTAGVNVIIKFIQGIGRNAVKLANAAFDVLIDFLNGLARAIRTKSGELREAGRNIASAIISGITGGLSDKAGSVASSAVNVAKGALGSVGSFLGIGSPSKEFIKIGGWMAEGMAVGLSRDRSAEQQSVFWARRTTDAFKEAIQKRTADMERGVDFNPKVRPVLDLSDVAREAKKISGYIPEDAIAANANLRVAQGIAASPAPNSSSSEIEEPRLREIKFEQNNYSPEALSTADLYRQTRNQITLAKDELEVA